MSTWIHEALVFWVVVPAQVEVEPSTTRPAGCATDPASVNTESEVATADVALTTSSGCVATNICTSLMCSMVLPQLLVGQPVAEYRPMWSQRMRAR